MGRYSIHATLIDGSFTKAFKSLVKVSEYVDSMEDFGEEGRRSRGFQGEFGSYEFDGFSWADLYRLKQEKYRNHVEFVQVDADWKLIEYLPNPITGYAEPVQLFAWNWTAAHQGSFFEILAVMGRYHVAAFDPESQHEDDCGCEIGRYRSFEEVKLAIVRWNLARTISRVESIFVPIHRAWVNETASQDLEEVPF